MTADGLYGMAGLARSVTEQRPYHKAVIYDVNPATSALRASRSRPRGSRAIRGALSCDRSGLLADASAPSWEPTRGRLALGEEVAVVVVGVVSDICDHTAAFLFYFHVSGTYFAAFGFAEVVAVFAVVAIDFNFGEPAF